MFYQRSIKGRIRLEGIGLHSGEPAAVTLRYAPQDTGVVFTSGGFSIKAYYENVIDTSYATALESHGVRVRTVEHLMAALSGLSIDNVIVEVEGPEVPILDGSSMPFVRAILEAGISVQKSPRRYIKILKDVTVHEGDKSATLLPSAYSRITYRIDFDHPMLLDQSLSIDLCPDAFEQEISSARTFGFLREVEHLQSAGLARGGSLDNAVVMDDERILNEEGLRFPDEFVRHKMLDAIGDVALIGMPFIGHLVADKSGHRLNHRLVTELMKKPDSWIIVEGEPARDCMPVRMMAAG